MDLLKRIMSKLLLNSKTNLNYEVVEKFYPDLVMCLHHFPAHLKRYSFFILQQIFLTPTNKTKNSLMPINYLQKDCKSSDCTIRAQAIKMLSNLSMTLNDICPFMLEIFKTGIHDSNPTVKQNSLMALLKLFSSCDLSFADYRQEL